LFIAFWAPKRGKLTQNHMKVTKLLDVKMADATENPLLTHTHTHTQLSFFPEKLGTVSNE
jgi:hypothetical protein